ncbi:MAG: hypothetical protein WC915_01410 [archaeon]|jgi:hypothetical protein
MPFSRIQTIPLAGEQSKKRDELLRANSMKKPHIVAAEEKLKYGLGVQFAKNAMHIKSSLKKLIYVDFIQSKIADKEGIILKKNLVKERQVLAKQLIGERAKRGI